MNFFKKGLVAISKICTTEGGRVIITCLTLICLVLVEFISKEPNPALILCIIKVAGMIPTMLITPEKRAGYRQKRMDEKRLKRDVKSNKLPASEEQAGIDEITVSSGKDKGADELS